MNENIDHYSNDDSIKSNNYENNISITSLEKILIKYEIPFEYYNLNGYQEEALCLEKFDSNWIIYYAERGRKYEKLEFDNINCACIEIIKRLSLNELQEKIMIDEYKQTKKDLIYFDINSSIESEIIYINNKISQLKRSDNSKRFLRNKLKPLIKRRNKLLEFIKLRDLDRYKKLYEVLDLKNDKTYKAKQIYINKKREIQEEVNEKLKYLSDLKTASNNVIVGCISVENAVNHTCHNRNVKITNEEWKCLENYLVIQLQKFSIGNRNFKICGNLIIYTQKKEADKIKTYLHTISKEDLKMQFNSISDFEGKEYIISIMKKILSL